MGDALLQKTYTTDFLTKKKVINNGIAPQYYVENSHEAIIPKDIFMRVQEEMMEFIRDRGGKPVEYDEGLVRKLIEKVIVYDELFTVIFKSGLDVDIEA